MSEIIKADIEVAFGDRVEIGRTEHPDNLPDMVYLSTTPPDTPPFLVYFATPRGLDDTIEGLIRARKEVFGAKP